MREFILHCVLAPALVCFAWMTTLGGTAIDLELSGALMQTAGKNNPMDALKSAMIIGALPFAVVMGLMCLFLIKALDRDGQREKRGIMHQPGKVNQPAE